MRSDLVQVFRRLRRAPTFTLATVLTLSLALGACIAVFGIVWDVLLRPLEVRDPHSLVVLLERMPEGGVEASPTSHGTFEDWRRELTKVQDVVAWEWESRTFEDPERPEELLTVLVSGDLLQVLGLRPALGRALTSEDEVLGAPARTAMISHRLWTRRFGADSALVGRKIPVDGVEREVVGVMPARTAVIGPGADLFLPSPHTATDPSNRGGRVLNVAARLAPGATVEGISSEVAGITERIALAFPTSARGWSAHARPVTEHILGDVRPRLTTAAVAVALLLLVAGANVANLLLVRAADERREMAVRAALGAGRTRLVRLHLVESLVLALAGAAGGIAMAAGMQRWVASAQGTHLPRALESGVPASGVVFGVVLAAVAGLAVGAAPALRESGRALESLGRGTAGGRDGLSRRARGSLLVAQLGMTTVLLIGAGLLVRTVAAIRHVDLGFRAETATAARISADPQRYPAGEAQLAYYDVVLERVRAIPGVEAAGLTSALPMDPVAANFDLPTRIDESVPWGDAPQADFRIVSPGLMEALGFRLLGGRFFNDEDRGGPLVAVVNRSLAEAFWPGESAVGKQIQNVWRQDGFSEVVGVVEDTRFYGPMQPSRTELFVPVSQAAWGSMTVVAGVRGDPSGVQAHLGRALIEVDPLTPPQEVFPVATLVEDTMATERFFSLILSGFAVLATILAATGVYGVVAYSVRLRWREMGVRLALGASRFEVTRTVLFGGVMFALVGVVLGLVAAVPSARLVSGMLFGIEPLDPLTLGSVALLLISVAVVAGLGPALRAARLDPATVLRDE
jgi:putative ABC transport system permease protein